MNDMVNTGETPDLDAILESEEKKHDPIDGCYELVINADLSEASVTVTEPFFDGKPASEDAFRRELEAKGIVGGIDDNAIQMAFTPAGYGMKHRIAYWTPPIPGEDGSVTYHYETQTALRPKEDENGFVDYHDLGLIRNIKRGAVIATIKLPTDGTPGVNIKGHSVSQQLGKPAKVSHGDNVGVSADGTQLLALADGNLVCSGNSKFAIETIVNLSGNVDVSTGNLDFIGDINIRGDVAEGFKVSSKKNIVISGSAVGAVLEAGGDIAVKQGCVNTQITAHGNVTLTFVETSNVRCDGNLKGDVFTNCDLYCGGEMTMAGSKGFLRGGRTVCLGNLTANVIGAESYAKTTITVGDNAVMLEEKKDIEKKIVDMELQLVRLTQAIEFLTAKKKAGGLTQDREEMLSLSIKTKLITQREKADLGHRIKEIEAYLSNKQNLCIMVKKVLYPGVKITINDAMTTVHETYQYCRVHTGDDGIHIDPLR